MHSEHYKISRLFMSWIGQWPEQSKFNRFFLSINVIFAISSQLCILIFNLAVVWQDWDFVIECISPIFIYAMILAKLFNCLCNTRKIENLLTEMRSSWNLATFDNQIQILKMYTAEGKTLIKAYIVVMYGCTFVYVTLPVVSSVMMLVTNSNQTNTYKLIYDVKATLNVEKYYYPILLHSFYTTIFTITVAIATDSILIAYVQHACGLFAIIGCQLENIKRDGDVDINIWPLRKNDEHYRAISETVVKHNEVLQFAELLESTYNAHLFILTIMNVMIITFGGVQVRTRVKVTVITTDRPLDALRFGVTTVTLTLHFLFLSMPGQKLIDHSTSVYRSICAAEWYAISLKARKSLNLMLMRSRRPCQLTAGKMCVMSLRTFSWVVRTSVSYFTVLSSVR